jgi:hypothetical protein
MARVVEAVVADFSDTIHWKIVVTKSREGAARHAELSKKSGRRMPVPAIVIGGQLVFDSIPSTDDLREYLESCRAKHPQKTCGR